MGYRQQGGGPAGQIAQGSSGGFRRRLGGQRGVSPHPACRPRGPRSAGACAVSPVWRVQKDYGQ